MKKTVFIITDHGLAIIYFLKSDVINKLLEKGIRAVVFVDDQILESIESQFDSDNLIFEGLRLKEAKNYWKNYRPSIQYWLDFLRRAGASNKINLEAVDSYIDQVRVEMKGNANKLFPLIMFLVKTLRNLKIARKMLVSLQSLFSPQIYTDLFDKYQPEMVIGSSPGWRYDKYMLREAAARKVKTTTAIIGWDNTSSYSLHGAKMNYAICWSELQKEELLKGSDWQADQVFIGGIPSYDGYINKKWLIGKEKYYQMHGLDPQRKLITYAASFLTFSPNIQNMKALADLVTGNELIEDCQLLIRLHPNHFMDDPRFIWEKEQVDALVTSHPHLHVVEPASLGGDMGHYSGEDMDEKSSMMEYADIFTTVYSTMVVEASVHDSPVVSICIDAEEGWKKNFYLPLSKVGGWPTHQRFRESGSGPVALDKNTLKKHINAYLKNPNQDDLVRKDFLKREITITDGSAGNQVGELLLGLIG